MVGILDKKLAEWVGLSKPKCSRIGGCLHEILSFKTSCICDDWVCPKFTNSLDACFKWLVPKLIGELGKHEATQILENWALTVLYHNENPALALCLAIEKLIDNEH